MQQTDLIKSRKYSPELLGNVCVVGLGATGLAVANYLISQMPKRVISCHIYAGDKTEFAMKTADKLLASGLTVSFDDKTIDQKYDLCIVSPGISNLSELYKSAKQNCTELISEVEFAWRESDNSTKWIAVSGTNGKTTTTSLINHIFHENNKHSVAVGNIGNVAIQQVASDRSRSIYEHTDIYVVEVSSYQLASCIRFAPDVAVLLNITPDHIKWHGSFDAYAQAKISLFNNCSTAIVNVEDKIISKYLNMITDNPSVKEIIEFGDVQDNIDVVLKGQRQEICRVDDLKIFGHHNHINAQAASAVCLCLGLASDQIAKGLKTFSSLEHRLEPCGVIAGTKYFNDSKATNVDAVLVALNSFEDGKAIFMMGGRDKETDLSELVDKAIKKLKGVVCFGECADRFYDAFSTALNSADIDDEIKNKFVLVKSGSMINAFHDATKITYPGDCVVLSPACASFDEFKSFEERGDAFKKLVKSFCRN